MGGGGLTGRIIKNKKMPKKVRQDSKKSVTNNYFCHQLEIFFATAYLPIALFSDINIKVVT